MEGTFDIGTGYVKMLSGPEWTREMLSRARDAVASTASALQATDDALTIHQELAALRAQVQDINPKLELLLAKNTPGKSKEMLLFFLSTLLTLLTWAVPMADAGRLTQDAVESIVRQVQHGQP